MAARTRFDPQPKSVRFFSDAERDEAYVQARPFCLEQMRMLLEDGWKQNDCNSEEFLFDISKPKKGRRLILPKTFAHFLDISKANTWRKIFENPAIFNARNKGKKNNLNLYIGPSLPLSNIFYLLQVLAPGMLVIYYEYQSHDADVKVSRLLPQASWIESNETMSKTDALLAAAKDRKIAFHEERTARLQNNSQHSSLPGSDALLSTTKDQKPSSHEKGKKRSQSSSLPGTDALPTAAKDQKIPSHEKWKERFQHSSLPGTDPLPTAAKDQKTASQKKKKRQPRSTNNSSYTARGYLEPDDYITTGDYGYEYGMCDKDCGWCGRCILNYDGDLL